MSLSAQNLFFYYDKRLPVLDKLTFSIGKGQFIGLFGPNGGGKTTLLKLLLGLLEPTSGTIEILGKSPKESSSKVGYVPQIRRFDKEFPISVFEVVLQGCLSMHRGWGGFSKDAKEKAYEALKKVDLLEKADSAFGTLSGGQLQRTLIARALASEPEILLLDEATVGIDPEALQEIFSFLHSLRGKITILLVTHDLQLIAHEMDQLLCVNREISSFSPAQVCEHFSLGLYHPLQMKKKDDNGPD